MSLVSEKCLAKFLALFAADPHDAAEQYLSVHRKLITVFAHRRVMDPEELADETLSRAMRKVCSGALINVPISRYCLGIARNVYREYRKRPPPAQLMEEFLRTPLPTSRLTAVESKILVRQCLAILKPAQRKLLRAYAEGDPVELARSRGLTPGHLRVAIHKLRRQIRSVVLDLVKDRDRPQPRILTKL